MYGVSYDVFISYARENGGIANKLKSRLEADGMSTFLAHEDGQGGYNWHNYIPEHIRDCSAFVALITEQFHLANFTEQEVGIALGCNKPIIPVCEPGTMPSGFISKYDCVKYDERKLADISSSIFEHLIIQNPSIDNEEKVDLLIKALRETHGLKGYKRTIMIADRLAKIKKFTKQQINDLASVYTTNNQVYQPDKPQHIFKQIFQSHRDYLNENNIVGLVHVFGLLEEGPAYNI